MKKDKYLYRKLRKSNHSRYVSGRHANDKNIDLFSDLPFHKGMGRKYKYGYDYRPLEEFIKSKIGENWDDVYSEILTKIDKKYKHEVDDTLEYYAPRARYDKFFVPRNRNGYMLYDQVFVDIDNILTKKTEEEILLESKKYYIKYLRLEKLKEIFENNEKEDITYNEGGLFEGE